MSAQQEGFTGQNCSIYGNFEGLAAAADAIDLGHGRILCWLTCLCGSTLYALPYLSPLEPDDRHVLGDELRPLSPLNVPCLHPYEPDNQRRVDKIAVSPNVADGLAITLQNVDA